MIVCHNGEEILWCGKGRECEVAGRVGAGLAHIRSEVKFLTPERVIRKVVLN